MKKKIFCSDCEYERDDHCNHPKNLEDDYYGKKHSRVNRPDDINQHNDCPWFKRFQDPL